MSSLSEAADSGPAAKAEEEPELSPEEIIGRYKTMRNETRSLATKMDELELEYNEHQLVLSSISKMESSRKSFRLIGGVLVQQTVGEVLPAVQDYKNMIKQLLDNVSGTLAAKEKEAAAWKVKYNIQTQQERELARAQAVEAAAAAPEKSAEAQKGVLA